MSAVAQAVELFEMGFPVRQIGEMVGLSRADLTEALTHFAQRPECSRTTTSVMRVCPFFDSCRDCTFPSCTLDRFREVTV